MLFVYGSLNNSMNQIIQCFYMTSDGLVTTELLSFMGLMQSHRLDYLFIDLFVRCTEFCLTLQHYELFSADS